MDIHKRRLLAGTTPSKPGTGAANANPIPSSSPAFATPAGPIRPPAAGGGAAAAISGQQLPFHPQPNQSPPRRPSHGTTMTTAAAGGGGGSKPAAATATILPVAIPPATLRPLAFRVFTKRHNLTLQASALAALAAFVGRHCGAGWRDEGLAERALDEAARRWKRAGGALIVEAGSSGGGGDANNLASSSDLARLLKDLAACMVGGKVVADKPPTGAAEGGKTGSMSRQTSFGVSGMSIDDGSSGSRAGTGGNGGVATRQDEEMGDDDDISATRRDPREHLKVIDAFEQPRLLYNATKRHFERAARPPSLFPDATTRTSFFKQRYHMVHQRLMRNEAFQAPTSVAVRRAVPSLQRSGSSFLSQQSYRLSSVTDLLGRPGSGHLLLGLLSIAPAGHYAISDLSGSITLDLSDAHAEPDWAWIVPGMMILVDGTYEEEGINGTTMVGSNTGIGGTIGGRFITSTITGPPAERREKTLGISSTHNQDEFTAASGFGWVDFLGVGSEKTAGVQMRKIESQFQKTEEPGGRGRVIIVGELNLDVPETLEALRKILGTYEPDEPGTSPLSFILTGSFVSTAGMARRGTAGSIEYKESFDLLASTLSDFPRLISSATFILVPGDNDPWASSFTASASTTLPRHPIPATFTSRIRRVFQQANAEREKTASANIEGEAVFTSNPVRLSLFGPTQEMVVLRDNMTGRVRRNLVSFQTHEEEAEANSDREESSMQVDTGTAGNEPEVPEAAKSKSRGRISRTDVKTARQFAKMIVDQAHLTPFSILKRPVLWDYGPALHMVPLPTALVVMDADAPPFALGYEGCFVMNPGRVLVENRKGQARWIEYDAVTKRGRTLQVGF